MLDREFDTDALAGLRQAVLGYATACGMPEDRAIDGAGGRHYTDKNDSPSPPTFSIPAITR